MSGTDDAAVWKLLDSILDEHNVGKTWKDALTPQILYGLRRAGHLRTPGKVEVGRETIRQIRTWFTDDPTMASYKARDKSAMDEIVAALAAGADDGENK